MGSTDRWALPAILLVALAVRLPAFLSQRHLSFDEGVFASSALAMRDGGLPFRDVFSSQGPLFLPLVWLGDLLGLRLWNAPRVLAVASGLAIVWAVWWTASVVATRAGAGRAAAIAAVSGNLLYVTGPLHADGPAIAFATIAVGAALRLRRDPRLTWAAVTGLAVGAALSTKAVEAPVLAPVAVVLLAPILSERRLDPSAIGRAVLAGSAAIAVFLAVSVPFGLGVVWEQAVGYHTGFEVERDLGGNLAKITSTLWDRDLALWWVGLVVLVAVAVRRSRPLDAGGADVLRTPSDTTAAGTSASEARVSDATWSDSTPRVVVGIWLLAILTWLVVMVHPLWRPHVSALIPPLAILLGTVDVPRRLLSVAVVGFVLLALVQDRGLLVPGPYRGSEARIVAALEALPASAWVLSDEPGLVWRSGHRTTDDLVDTSMLRQQQGHYTAESIAEAASDPHVCAVVVRSALRFGALEGLAERLTEVGYTEAERYRGVSRLYVRDRCDPPS